MKYTEEEKKAIKGLKRLKEILEINIPNSIKIKEIKTILNLLEKQQKEIEKLERINKDYDLIYTKQYEYIQDCISKKVIREKIEELKDKEQEFTDEQGYWGDSSIQHKIEILEELLVE